jgi:hypothetical protein
MLYLLLRSGILKAEQSERLRDIIRDSESLLASTSFLKLALGSLRQTITLSGLIVSWRASM